MNVSRAHAREAHRLHPDNRGVLHSEAFPGLRLVVNELLAGNLAAVLAEQSRG